MAYLIKSLEWKDMKMKITFGAIHFTNLEVHFDMLNISGPFLFRPLFNSL